MRWLRTWPMEPDGPSSNCGSRTFVLWDLQEEYSESMVLEVSDTSKKCRYSKQLQLCIRGENQEPACDD